MKLKDILARELAEWPNGEPFFGQQANGSLITCRDGVSRLTLITVTKAEDFETAWVTRAEWQAAVEALKFDTCDHSYANKLGCPECGKEHPLEIKWPDGAEFCGAASNAGFESFYRNILEDSYEVFCANSKWVKIIGSPAYTLLIPRPTERAVEWDGVSVPPAGTECEYRVGHGGWFKCSIRYVTTPYHDCPVEVVMFAYHLGCEQTGVVGSGEGELEFRSIRTQEQIEAEEREKAINKVYDSCNADGRGVLEMLGEAYDAGRKQVAS